jgi:hypothetical protein
VTLADIAGRLEFLRIECKKCERSAQYRVMRLMKELGPRSALIALKDKLTWDCANKGDKCDARFPDLPKLTRWW